MINVVIVSDDLISSKVLMNETDMTIHIVKPTHLERLVDQVAAYAPNIIVIDDSNTKLNIDILSYVCSLQCPDAPIIVLIENSPDFVMLQSSAFKVRGYISREQRPLLAKAIRVVNDGEAWLPRKLVAEMLDYFSTELAYKPAANLKLVNS